jgi:hypothetical protein
MGGVFWGVNAEDEVMDYSSSMRHLDMERYDFNLNWDSSYINISIFEYVPCR